MSAETAGLDGVVCMSKSATNCTNCTKKTSHDLENSCQSANESYGGSRKDAGQAIGKSGDEGIDGIISEDRLGLDVVYLQAKKWDGCVGRPEIQKFVGALHGKRAKKGVFITTGTFSQDARAYVDHIDPKVVLIDGRHLAELMIDFEVGVSTSRTYHVKRIDSDYFDEG